MKVYMSIICNIILHLSARSLEYSEAGINDWGIEGVMDAVDIMLSGPMDLVMAFFLV